MLHYVHKLVANFVRPSDGVRTPLADTETEQRPPSTYNAP